jgi:hypothetical protein
MALRLAMVGVVAALGLTVPSGRVCQWYNSANSWTRSLLAGGDSRTDGSVLASSSGASHVPRVCEQCRLARARLAAKAKQSRASADPVTVAEPTTGPAKIPGGSIQKTGTSVAAKTSSSTIKSAVVKAPKPVKAPAPIAPQQPMTIPVVALPARLNPRPAPEVATAAHTATVHVQARSPKPFDELPANVFATPVVALVAPQAQRNSHQQISLEPRREQRDLSWTPAPNPVAEALWIAAGPMSVIDDLDSQILSTLVGRVSANDVSAQPADAVICDSLAEGVTDDEFLCGEVPDDGCFVAPTADTEVAAPEPEPEAIGAEAQTRIDAGLDFESELIFDAELSAQAPVVATTRTSAELPWPVFAPERQDANVPSPQLTVANRNGGAANSVQRAQEALAPPAKGELAGEYLHQPVRSAARGAAPASELGNAVQMTRHAVVAWVRVLTGPAIVNVTAR